MPINPALLKNILVVRNDRFGEFLLNIPALRALKETFPNAKIIALVNPLVKELARRVGYIDEITEWSQGRHTLAERLWLLKLLKSKKLDMAVMLNPSQELNILTCLAGIPVRVGYDRKWGFLLTHKIKDLKYLGLRHEIEYNLELVSLIQAKTGDKTPSLKIDNDIIRRIWREYNLEGSSDCVALHPWTSDPVKEWPLNNFQELARRMVEEMDIKLVLVGAGENSARSQSLFADLGQNFINLTGKTTLVQLAALLKRCKLLISCDSGPVHLACAVGTKVLAIFRNDIPGKSARRWGPWGEGHIVIENGKLCDITVAEVFDKAKEVLNNK